MGAAGDEPGSHPEAPKPFVPEPEEQGWRDERNPEAYEVVAVEKVP